MLFDFFRKHTRVLQVLLVLLIFPSFVIFGIQGYDRLYDNANTTVASVDGQSVKQADWDLAQREQVQRMQRQNPNIDVRVFDTPQAKQSALESIVRRRVLLAAANDAHFFINDELLAQQFKSDPQFAMIRNPDGTVNKQFLAMQGLSSEMFVQQLRQDIGVRQVVQGVASTAIAPAAAASAAFDALLQRREIQVQRFEAKHYAAKVTPSDADIEKYYNDPAHAAQFKAPETASIELLTLDLESLKKSVKPTDEELRKYYTENVKRYTVPEERRASHIHVQVAADAAKDAREKARARAEGLLAQVQKNPASFGDVARKNSDDAGSADKGGDLDYFGRGGVGDQAFDDAVFGLKQIGDISGVVQSDDGFHIIKLTDIRAGKTASFESARGEIEDEVRKQLAQKKYTESANDFTNMVYEQSDSLKPAAEKFKLEIHKVERVPRAPAPGASGPLASAKFLDALFSADSIAKKRNTDAIEYGSNQMVSGRIVQHTPARQLTLAEVRDKVRQRVIDEQAIALARKEGEARLAELQKDPKLALAGAPITVSRSITAGQPRAVIDLALKSDATKVPTVTGGVVPGEGYAVVRITKVLPRDPAIEASALAPQYAQAWGEAEFVAYYEALKNRYKVDMKGHTEAAAAAASSASASN